MGKNQIKLSPSGGNKLYITNNPTKQPLWKEKEPQDDFDH